MTGAMLSRSTEAPRVRAGAVPAIGRVAAATERLRAIHEAMQMTQHPAGLP